MSLHEQMLDMRDEREARTRKVLINARLMLYAWKGSRPKEWGEHEELNRAIKEIEELLK